MQIQCPPSVSLKPTDRDCRVCLSRLSSPAAVAVCRRGRRNCGLPQDGRRAASLPGDAVKGLQEAGKIMRAIRILLVVQIALFGFAALTHFGVIVGSHWHRAAGTAESVIAVVLLVGLSFTWMIPSSIRSIAIAVQAFALLGTFVGIATIVAGIGPRSTLDIIFHGSMVIAL